MTIPPVVLLAVSIISAANPPAQPATTTPTPASSQKAILVTGASSGFGRRVTERLAAEGHLVYATARKESDIAALDAIPNVKALRLDVTKPADIAAAVKTVADGGLGLYGVVNNAGVAFAAPVSRITDADYQYVMDVNVLGVLRVTRAFLPLLQASKGRVVNIGSMAGLFGFANGALYTMSKHAVEAFTDSLAADVATTGIAVSVVEPGNYRTDLLTNFAKYARESAREPEVVKRIEERGKAKSQEKDPEDVAVAVRRALFDETPRRRYLTLPNKGEADLVMKKQVERLVQLNESQSYAYSRDELVALLDATLAQAKPRTELMPDGDAKRALEAKAGR